MSQIEKWQKQYETIDPAKGGYSDVRLWPCYMIFTSLILFLAPITGMFLAFVIVTIPAIYIALKAVKIKNSNPEKAAAEWKAIRDMYSAIELKDELAALDSKKLALEVKSKEELADLPEADAPKTAVAFIT